MTLQEIKDAVLSGKIVHWSNKGYTVHNDNHGQWLIVWLAGHSNENAIGLTWSDGVTLNGKESEFFTG